MRICLIGDLHLDHKIGNKLTIDFVDKYRSKIVETANSCDHVVFMGDYFRHHNSENGYRKYLTQLFVDIKSKKIAILGQHDKDSKGNILQPIEPAINDLDVTAYDDGFEIVKLSHTDDDVDAAFISHNRDDKRLKEQIQKAINEKVDYVFGHFNINGYDLGFKKMESSINIGDFKKTKFYLGDIHKYQLSKNVTYVGSIAPTNLGEAGYEFGIGVLDTKKDKFERIKFDYKIREINAETIEDADDIDENTILRVDIKQMKEKAKWMNFLADKKYLEVIFEMESAKAKKKKIDFNMKFEDIMNEYLKLMGKEHLKAEIKLYLESCK